MRRGVSGRRTGRVRGQRRTQRMYRTRRRGCGLYGGFFGRLGRWFRADGLDSSGRLRARGLGGFGMSSFGRLRRRSFGLHVGRAVSTGQPAAQFQRDIVIERTRMRFLVRDAQLG
jgi:hypothetical protein